jgi:hypothetical protein
MKRKGQTPGRSRRPAAPRPSLTDVDLSVGAADLPADVRSFLRDAERRIELWQADGRHLAFVPCDFARAYRVLRAVADANAAPGRLFCEWGSGYGVVACLAAMLDFDAFGIEIEGELVDAARELADDHGLPVEFVRGSFIPAGGVASAGGNDVYAWLTLEEGAPLEPLGLAADDFDVVFAYPWPDEERLTEVLFDRHAAPGAVLVTYHGGDRFRIRRKDRRRGAADRGR